MGDRTTTRTTIARHHLDTVRELLFAPGWKARGIDFDAIDDNGDGTVTVTRNEVNYGGEYDAEALCNARIPFVINHDSGYSYPAGWIAFDGIKQDSIFECEGHIVVPFNEETGEVDEAELIRAREFVAHRSACYAVMRAARAVTSTRTQIPKPENER